MKQTLRFAQLFATSALLALTTAASAESVLVRKGLSAPVEAWTRAVEAGDSAAIARMNPNTTTVYGPSEMVTRGTEAIVSGYRGMFDKFNVAVQITDASYIQTGSVVHSWGLYTLTLSPKAGGEVAVVKGRFSDIATRNGNQWQYIMDHASVPQTP